MQIEKALNDFTYYLEAPVIGRDKDIQAIREQLLAKRILGIINPLSGVGKTTLVNYYWDQYKSEYEHIASFTTDINLETELIANYHFLKSIGFYPDLDNVGLTIAMQSADGGENRMKILDIIYEKLAALEGNTLFIIECDAFYDCIHVMLYLLDRCPNVHILFTSQTQYPDMGIQPEIFPNIPINKRNQFIFNNYNLKTLDPRDAMQLFYAKYDPKNTLPHDDTIVARICKNLGNHPLTLEILAKTLHHNPDITFPYLITELEEYLYGLDLNLIPDTQPTDKYLEAILDFCFCLSKFDEDEAIVNTLIYFSLLPSHDIDQDFLETLLKLDYDSWVKNKDSEEREVYRNGLKTLTKTGWIQFLFPVWITYNCSSLIQQMIRNKYNIDEISEEVMMILIKEIPEAIETAADPEFGESGTDAALKYLPYARYILKYVSEEDPSVAMLNCLIQTVYLAEGELAISHKFGIKALEICEKHLPSDHIQLGTCYFNMCNYHQHILDWQEALSFGLKALEILQKNLPEDTMQLASIYQMLAFNYFNLQKWEKALQYQQKVLIILLNEDPYNSFRVGNAIELHLAASLALMGAKGPAYAEPYIEWYQDNCSHRIKKTS